jgi:toxin FitB
VVLDSSCWLEHFAGTPRAGLFAPVLQSPSLLVVPVLTIYEVVKKLSREAGGEVASQALSLMRQGELVALGLDLSLQATRHALPLADSLIYATALAFDAELWTQDAQFDGLPSVRYFDKRPR